MRRGYEDFLELAGCGLNVDAWRDPASEGAYIALRTDADAVCLTGQSVFSLSYTRSRSAPGGVIAAVQPGDEGGAIIGTVPGYLGVALLRMNLNRFAPKGAIDEDRLQASMAADPLLAVEDGRAVNLQLAPAYVFALMRGAVASPVFDRYRTTMEEMAPAFEAFSGR